jgi:hypothetical protein
MFEIPNHIRRIVITALKSLCVCPCDVGRSSMGCSELVVLSLKIIGLGHLGSTSPLISSKEPVLVTL